MTLSLPNASGIQRNSLVLTLEGVGFASGCLIRRAQEFGTPLRAGGSRIPFADGHEVRTLVRKNYLSRQRLQRLVHGSHTILHIGP